MTNTQLSSKNYKKRIIFSVTCDIHTGEINSYGFASSPYSNSSFEGGWSKEKLKKAIRDCLCENLDSLENVIAKIIEINNSNLAITDIAYIERKYIKYCSQFWTKETVELIEGLNSIEGTSTFEEYLNQIEPIQNFSQVPEPWNELDFFKLLVECDHKIPDYAKIRYINNWKTTCIRKIISLSQSLKKQLEFIEAFSNLLTTFKDSKAFTHAIQVSNFLSERLTFQEFYEKIVYQAAEYPCNELNIFIDLTKKLNLGNQFNLKNTFNKLVDDFFKPPDIKVQTVDGRTVVEVIATSLIMSEILHELERMILSNSDITEIRLVIGRVIHIDEDLQNDFWHGKNIVIFTKLVKIYGNITWNVSGRDSSYKYSLPAETDDQGNGTRGKDGYAGESGGNILLQVECIERPECFMIISNGGNGSKGQDGGKGRDGQNGTSISAADFENNFPRITIPFNNERNLNKTKDNINNKFPNLNEDRNGKPGIYRKIFMEGKNDEGHEITFSTYDIFSLLQPQAFLIYRGSPGEKEGVGGEFGLGGKGGYCGEITCNLPGIIKQTQPGIDAEDGRGGLYGKPGRSGWDIGYTDYATWRARIFFGMNENCKLKLNKHIHNAPDHIYCFQYDCYISITASNIDNQKVRRYEERQNVRDSYQRKQHAQAIRKKTISRNLTLNNYSQYVTKKDVLQNIKSSLEEMQRRGSEFINQLTKEKQKSVGVKKILMKKQAEKEKQRNILLLDQEQSSIKSICKTENEEEFQMYSFIYALLQEIDGHLTRFKIKNIATILKAETAANFLMKAKQKIDISHTSLGTLNQYVYGLAERDIVFDYCKEDYTNNSNDIFVHAIKRFIIEHDNIQVTTSPEISTYIEQFKNFAESDKDYLNKFLNSFMATLFDTKYEYICALWWSNFKNGTPPLTIVDEQISKHSHLSICYNNLIKQFSKEYDWKKCCKDEAVIEELHRHISTPGSLPFCYRELLAHIYDVNIRTYAEENNQYHMVGDHNPSSREIVYFLFRDNEIIEMSVDENYLELNETFRCKNTMFARILEDPQSLKNDDEISNYALKKEYLDPSYDVNRKINLLKYASCEQSAISEIIQYYSPTEGMLLHERLEKLSAAYIGPNAILYYLRQRFSVEGKNITCQELSYIINYMLTSVVNDNQVLNIFTWIIASHEQKEWLHEFLIIKLQNYFRQTLTQHIDRWRDYLTRIRNRSVLLLFQLKLDRCKGALITMEHVDEIFHLLKTISHLKLFHLERLELCEWLYDLREQYFCHVLSENILLNDDQMNTVTYYLKCLLNTFGGPSTEILLKNLMSNKVTSLQLIEILSKINDVRGSISVEDINGINNQDIVAWMKKIYNKVGYSSNDRDINELVDLMQQDCVIAEDIRKRLSNIKDSVNSISKNHSLINLKETITTITDFLTISNHYKNKTDEEIMVAIDSSIKHVKGFKLRDTQKLAIMTFLSNDRSILAQISTGEGKSLIIVAISIIKAIRKERVDIVTSSSVLAKRDADLYKKIYNAFGIQVGHNCSENIDKRKQAYSNNKVIYGDLSNFQRDYLLDKFYGKNILGDHTFENVIVDEVDSMLVDKGNNMLYLSHEIAGFDKLESLYTYIWQWINRPFSGEDDLSHVFNVQELKDAIISDLYGVIKKEDLMGIQSSLTESQLNSIWYSLLQYEILDSEGKIIQNDISYGKLLEILPNDLCEYANRLEFVFQRHINREKFIRIPNYLKSFAVFHLETWIKSAQRAMFMKEFQDYIVDVDRTGCSTERNPNIIILDRDTGTDQSNSQWDEALHQFLQLKHGCKLTLQSLKSIFISNVSYFKLYNKMYGLTGTLGSQRERELLKEIHHVDFMTIPTSKFKRFTLLKSIECCDEIEWVSKIQEESEMIIKGKRSILIICETVNDVEILEKAFIKSNVKNVHTYVRDYEDFDIADKLEPGHVIISTNLAGRGTDIRLTKEMKESGGLHVCLSYLPDNSRIEEQAFGRAARCGDKGSGRLIAIVPDDNDCAKTTMTLLKKKRDTAELQRLSGVKSYFLNQILAEESYFKQFRERFEQLRQYLINQKVNEEIQRILFDSCLDNWAFFLDRMSPYINNITDVNCQKHVDKSLNEFLENLSSLKVDSWSSWFQHNPIRMTKLAKYLGKHNKTENAIGLFDNVIEKEPEFCDAAHYYKAYVLVNVIDWKNRTQHKDKITSLKNALKSANKLFSQHIHYSMASSAIIGRIKKMEYKRIVQINSYEEQKRNTCELYSVLSQSIDNILGKPIYEDSLVSDDINEETAKVLYVDLLEAGILKKPKVQTNISEEDVKVISREFGISYKILYQHLILFQNKEVQEDEFLKELELKLQLPSKETFWQELIQCEILNNEIEYVFIHRKSIVEYFNSVSPILIEEGQKCIKDLKERPVPNELFFNHELFSPEYAKNAYMLEISAFRRIIGEEKYELLKNKNVFTFNKKATVNLDCISNSMSRYDGITIEDFDKINIIYSDAEQILASLEEQKIIERSSSDNMKFNLIAEYEDISRIILPFCPAYAVPVKELLFVCFAYRVCLQQICNQIIHNKQQPIQIQLISSPHKILYLELIDRRIIKPAVMRNNIDSLEERLENMYSRVLEKNSIEQLLMKSCQLPTNINLDDLINHLTEKSWFVLDTKSLDTRYFIQEKSNRLPLINYQDYDRIIGRILDNHLQLSISTKDNYNTLLHFENVWKSLKLYDCKLTDIFQYCNNKKIASEEIVIFSLNSFDEIIQLEKRCPPSLLFFLAVLIGCLQILAGCVMNFLKKGYMSHISNTLIEEGIHDLIWVLSTEKLTIQNYAQHKMMSWMATYLKNGPSNNRVNTNTYLGLGIRTVTRVLNYTKENYLSEQEQTNAKAEMQNNVHRLIVKVKEGFAYSSSYTGYDKRMDRYLKNLCDNTRYVLLQDIRTLIQLHEITETVKKCLEKYEQDEVINILTKCFNDESRWTSFSAISNIIVNYIIREMKTSIVPGIAKLDKYSLSNIKTKFQDITPLVDHVDEINIAIKKFLDQLNIELLNLLRQENAAKNAPLQKPQNEWGCWFYNKLQNIIEQHIVSEIHTQGAYLIERRFQKKILKVCQDSSINTSYYDDIKRKYYRGNTADDEEINYATTVSSAISDIYYENLTKLVYVTKNRALFLKMLKENTPLDKVYIRIFTYVITQMLNLAGVTVVTSTEDGSSEKFSSISKEAEVAVIHIQIVKGSFQLRRASSQEQAHNSNNFYDALSDEVTIDMTAEKFVNGIVEIIEQDTEAQRILHEIWNCKEEAGPIIANENITSEEHLESNDPKMDNGAAALEYSASEIKSNFRKIVAQLMPEHLRTLPEEKMKAYEEEAMKARKFATEKLKSYLPVLVRK